MTSRALVALAVLGIAASSTVATKERVTPVEKVITLLSGLQTKLEAEAKAEAAQYDKFACYCKEQVDQSQYEEENHVKNINALDATIDKLGTDLNALSQDIGELSGKITSLDRAISADAEARADEHARYKSWAKQLADAISALERAITAMKDSKNDMDDGVKLDLAQVQKVAGKMGADVSMLQKIKQNPESYEYRSNTIISTLEELHAKFLNDQKEHDKDEFEAQSAFEERDNDNKRQKTFTENDKIEKEKIAAFKDEQKSDTEAKRTDAATEQTRNRNYLQDLKRECQEKAELWDSRSQGRAAELHAISEALGFLDKKVKEQYSANSKLVGLQVKKDSKAATPSFLQVRNARRSNRLRGLAYQGGSPEVESSEAQVIARRAASLLSTAATSLGSKTLALAAIRVTASDDHFVKVRMIIKDLMARLQADADSEATQKDFCDKAMANGVKDRDDAQAAIESTSATIEQKTAQQEKASLAVAELAKQIADLNKALVEATELREQEKADNEQTLATANEGKDGVDQAIQVLSQYYGQDTAFLQKQPFESAAPKDDKDVRDTKPEIFEEAYNGAQAASKGILGLLDVIAADFQRTIDTVTEAERTAAQEYEAAKNMMNQMISDKGIAKKTQEDLVAELGKELLGHESDLKDAKDAKQNSLDTLSALEADCVAAEETYAERVAAREKEIAALKEAHNILENWKGL